MTTTSLILFVVSAFLVLNLVLTYVYAHALLQQHRQVKIEGTAAKWALALVLAVLGVIFR